MFLKDLFKMEPPIENLDLLSKDIKKTPTKSFQNLSDCEIINLSKFLQLTKIGFDNFRNLHSMKELMLPPKIKEIRSGSFTNCTSLEILDFSKYPELETISYDCFTKIWSLQELIIGPYIKEIRSGSFCECTKLLRLDLSNALDLVYLSYDAFANSFSLREIIFPENTKISEIRSGAFQNCTSLTRLDLSNCVELQQISFDIFVNAWSLQEIILGPNIKEIKSGAFRNCTSLTRLRIPASVTKISWEVFSGCTQLEEVILEGDTEVDPDAFQNCPRLERRVFPRRRLQGCLYGKYADLKESLKFEQGKGGICGISLEEFQEDSDIVVLPCGHAYIEEAFNEWISKRKICPTCKAEL
jgi:hypothetical protein